MDSWALVFTNTYPEMYAFMTLDFDDYKELNDEYE